MSRTAVEASHEGPGHGGPWWREPQLGLLVLLVLGVYFTRLGDPSLRGEETRRAQIAVEMGWENDWVVPRQQGEPFLSRPPLQNWLIGLTARARGAFDAASVRLPSVVAVLLTAVLIYGYARTTLGPLGALAAGAAFTTMAQVLELGRLGETEALFTLLLGGALLVWHWGTVRAWPGAVTWGTAYFLVALATLAKGSQPLPYFVAAVGFFLLWTRRWREALTRGHLIGILVFAAVWGAWQVPFTQRLGWEATRRVYSGDVALRFVDTRWTTTAEHVVTYPLEILACMLPWSVLLLAYARRDFRRAIAAARPQVVYLTCAVVATFPTVLLAPGARGRYFMPLYPCFAVLVGLVVERCSQAPAEAPWRPLWRNFLWVLALLMPLAGVGLLVAGWLGDGESPFVQPGAFAVVYAVAAMLLGVVAWWAARATRGWRPAVGVLSVAAFLGLTYSGAVVNSLVRRSADTAAAVARLKQQLPAEADLLSLGVADHIFAFYYGKPIELVSRDEWSARVRPGETFFCVASNEGPDVQLPFSWTKIAVVSCERYRLAEPRRVVVVGTRSDGR